MYSSIQLFGTAQVRTHVQFHQEVRADGKIHRLGHVRDLEPGGDAADARSVHLHDCTGTQAQIVGKLAWAV
jgi:hypothetical protein